MVKNKRNRQNGIAVGMLLGIVALVAIIGIVVAGSLKSDENSVLSDATNKLYAGAVMNQAGDLKTGMNMIVAGGTGLVGVTKANITLDSAAYNPLTGTVGLFNAANGGAEFVSVNNVILTDSTTTWLYSAEAGTSTVDFDGNGTNDDMLYLKNIKTEICNAINSALGLAVNEEKGSHYCSNGIYKMVVSYK